MSSKKPPGPLDSYVRELRQTLATRELTRRLAEGDRLPSEEGLSSKPERYSRLSSEEGLSSKAERYRKDETMWNIPEEGMEGHPVRDIMYEGRERRETEFDRAGRREMTVDTREKQGKRRGASCKPDTWQQWMQRTQEHIEEMKQAADKYEDMYQSQKELLEESSARLITAETSCMKAQKHCKVQSELMTKLRLDREKLADELEHKTAMLEERTRELKAVKQRSGMITKKFAELEEQLLHVEEMRRSDLDNLRSVESSFEASEQHLSNILGQVRNLLEENDQAHLANKKLNKEKIQLDKCLNIAKQTTCSLTAELAQAHQELKTISKSLKAMYTEKEQLYTKISEQRSEISRLEQESEDKDRLLEVSRRSAAELESQLKLSNLCLSRALGSGKKADIFPRADDSCCSSAVMSSDASISPRVKTLQDALVAKDATIMRLIDQVNKLEEEIQDTKMELLKSEEMNKVNEKCYREVNLQPNFLNKEIEWRDQVIDSLKLTVEKVIAQRNRLGLQCVRKKEQVELLKQKNKALQDIMLIGNHLYDQGLKKIQSLKATSENGAGPALSVLMHTVEDIEYREKEKVHEEYSRQGASTINWECNKKSNMTMSNTQYMVSSPEDENVTSSDQSQMSPCTTEPPYILLKEAGGVCSKAEVAQENSSSAESSSVSRTHETYKESIYMTCSQSVYMQFQAKAGEPSQRSSLDVEPSGIPVVCKSDSDED